MRLANQFHGQRSKIKVTRPINADIHRAPYLLNGKAYELQTWYTDGGRRPASATSASWPPRSKVKVARSRYQYEPSWPNDVPVSLESGGDIPCRPNPAATLLVVFCVFWVVLTVVCRIPYYWITCIMIKINRSMCRWKASSVCSKMPHFLSDAFWCHQQQPVCGYCMWKQRVKYYTIWQSLPIQKTIENVFVCQWPGCGA